MKTKPFGGRRYGVIGMGAAGIAAAEAIRAADLEGLITLISDEKDGYYSRPGLAYYLTGEIPAHFLFPFNEMDFKEIGIQRIHGQVSFIDPDNHQIRLSNGQIIAYDRLLIAVGAQATRPALPGIGFEGVVTLDSLDDARKILKLARHTGIAAVIGGGITAIEIVEGLIANGIRPHYLLRGDHYWSSVLDETEALIVEHRLKEEGVILHPQTELSEIIGSHGKVKAIRTTKDEIIPTPILGVAIGVQPRKELAVKAKIKVDKGILVDQFMRTSQPDIFAAGDVAQVYDSTTGKSLLNSLWDPARKQGSTAGKAMAGDSAIYQRDLSINVTRLAGITTTLIGSIGGSGQNNRDNDLTSITHGDSEAWRERPEAIIAQANYEVNRLRLLVGTQTLLGALVMGDQTLSEPIRQLVDQKRDISAIRERLLEPGANLTLLIQDFIKEAEPVYDIQ